MNITIGMVIQIQKNIINREYNGFNKQASEHYMIIKKLINMQ